MSFGASRAAATKPTRVSALKRAGVIMALPVYRRDTAIATVAQRQDSEKFMQADGSSTRSQGGTSLGLAVCKTLIEGMGGKIGYTSESGAGTTFYFDLTLAGDTVTSTAT
jgi:K+-sensing histidine kinase KdpD